MFAILFANIYVATQIKYSKFLFMLGKNVCLRIFIVSMLFFIYLFT